MEMDSSFKEKINLNDLDKIRRFIETELQAFRVQPEAIYDLQLAVTEVVTNIITHGYQKDTGWVEIVIKMEDTSAVVVIKDRAVAFNPLQNPSPDITLPLNKRPLGGMGVFLIKDSIDHITHAERPGGGNELILIKENAVTL